ncbi:MAG: hypothetical protein GY917_09005, partial [Planctomycetaceae bacterium]|nr:hypothetical protein [Planctomycetaceae bacterium]
MDGLYRPVRIFLGVIALMIASCSPFSTVAAEQTPAKPASATFYEAGKLQKIHLQIKDADLAKMKAALPSRIYVPAT